jgi:alpha-D-glucose phosphate-specific phosphoglucomutase
MIKFGTSGWRGIIADDFTFANVRLATQAISSYLNKKADEAKKTLCSIVVGYDTRFMSEKFAESCSEVLAGNGIKTYLCKRDTPTPVISYEILRRKTDGGINFTASHNPPTYNGLKFSPSWGGPALPETTQAIEKYCREIKIPEIRIMGFSQALDQRLVEVIDPRQAYLKRIKQLVDLKAIGKSGIRIAVDLLNGTGAGYLDSLIEETGCRCSVLGKNRDVLFSGHAPEPSKENLGRLFEVMKKESCRIGLATDGDADRFGILDSDGAFINPNETIALLFYHLIKTRSWKGIVARSVMTTHLIDKIAAKFGIEVRETPVGFKFIGEILSDEPDKFIIGGEESGGLTIRGHVPEKDGILACLLAAEMAAVIKKPLSKMLKEIEGLVGAVHSDRVNFHLAEGDMGSFRDKLERKRPKNFGGLKVKNTVTLDGFKYLLEGGSWIGFRLSGTEPVVRMYVESDSAEKIKKLISAGKKFVAGEKPV